MFSAVESICTRGQFGHVTHRVSGRTKNVEPPCLSGKGTITIKKHYVDEYNEKYSNNQIKIESLLDVAFENRKIILSKK